MPPDDPEEREPTPGRSRRRAFAGSFASSGWTQGALAISGILTARMLGTEARGELALLTLLAAAFGLVGTLGLPLAVTYEIAQRGRDPHSVLRAVIPSAAIQIAVFTVLHGLTLAFALRATNADLLVAGLATLVWAPAFIAMQFGLAILQGALHLDVYNVLRSAPATTYAGAIVVLWLARVHTLEAIAIAFAVAYVLSAALVLIAARSGPRVYGRAEDAPDVPEMRRFGLRALPGWFVPIEAFRLDQAAVGLLVSPAALGLYVVAVAFTNLPRFAGQSIGAIAFPLVARQADRDAARREVTRIATRAALLISVLVLVTAAAVGWLLPLLFGEEFEEAVPLARILLPSGGLLALRHVLTDAVRGAGFVAAGSLAEVVSWVVLIVGVAALVPRYEATGVAFAMLASSAASLGAFVWVWRAGSRRERAEVEVATP